MKVLREILNVPTWVDADEDIGMIKGQMLKDWERTMAGEKPKERYCVDCANMATDGTLLCKRPIIDLVTGQPWTLDLACHTERRPGGGCGENPKFWLPKQTGEVYGGKLSAEEDDGA